MGEIGFPRQEFLNDIRWWEVRSIIRGYNARHRTSWEQSRFVAHQVHYCMGVAPGQSVKTPAEWITFPWERDAAGDDSDIPTLAEANELRRRMMEENARMEAENKE